YTTLFRSLASREAPPAAPALQNEPQDGDDDDHAGDASRDHGTARAHQLERSVTVVDRENAEREIARTTRDRNRGDERQRSDLGQAGSEYKELEWCRRRQECGNHQGQQTVSLVQR